MWTAREEPIDSPDAVALLRAYFVEIVDRYHGRPMPASLVDQAMAEDPDTGIAAFLVARQDGAAAGCVGLREAGLITRMYIAPGFRRQGWRAGADRGGGGGGSRAGAHPLRLDTRHDLVEARALYAATGYEEVEPFNDEPFAERFFEKRLA